MSVLVSLLCFLLSFNLLHAMHLLHEVSIQEELPTGSIVTSLTDKIPNLDQSIEYDLVSASSNDLDLFSIDHEQHSLMVKSRIDYEHLCSKKKQCTISVSIAVSNENTIDVYMLPIRILNINDNAIQFRVNRTVIEIEENDEHWSTKSYPLPKAYDADGDLITYSIYLQNWNKPEGLFDFDEANLLLKPLKKFDREDQNIYLLRLIAHNQNDAATDIIVLIKDLNDNPPKCDPNSAVFLISNISAPSTYALNVTDLDEGDNGKLDYRLVHPLAGFSIDRYNGQIKFDARKWIRSNQSTLIVNVTDHGKPSRLSTRCTIELKFTSVFHIEFQSTILLVNQTDIHLEVKNPNHPLGRFRIYDKQEMKLCSDCLIRMDSPFAEMFDLHQSTHELHFNFNSMLLMKILTNYSNKQEDVSFNAQIEITSRRNPSMISTKNYSFHIHLDKIKMLQHSNILFVKVPENMHLNERIPVFAPPHHCLNQFSNEMVLFDPTRTFRMDDQLDLTLNKYLSVKQRRIYHLTLRQKRNNHTKETNLCSIQLHVYVFNPYSIASVLPYFAQPFYILSSKNMSHFSLPPVPPPVKYTSSVPGLISIDPSNASIIIRSSSLYSSYYYDFQIEAVDVHIPSLSSSAPVRIFFGINKHSPRLSLNSTPQSIAVTSSKFLYQIAAYDPDILFNDQSNLIPPAIEYDVEPSDNIEIERFTGRIFLTNSNTTKVNFTVIMTDFGQPSRLTTRHVFVFNIASKEKLSASFLFMIVVMLIVVLCLIMLLFFLNCCCRKHKKSSKSQEKTAWKNISPTAPNSCLIDNEYLTTTASLPRVSSREQRIYPTLSATQSKADPQQHHHRRPFSHLSLEKADVPYLTDKASLHADYQQRLSTTDINKYLERFEKIYNDSPSQHYLHQPLGSVV